MAESSPGPNVDASAPLGEVGALAGDKFLWVSLAALREGTGLRRLAVVGAALLAVGFFIPVTLDLQHWLMPWKAADSGPTFALFFPLGALAVGLAVMFARAIPKHVAAGLMAAAGVVGLLTVLAPMGKYGGAPRQTVWLLQLGLILGACSVTARIYRPRDAYPRYGVIAGAVLAAIGLMLPLSDAATAIPLEFTFYIARSFKDMSLVSADLAGIDHDLMVRFLSLWSLVPLVLLPAAAAMSWQRPEGVWDKGSAALRPMAWVIVLYVPMTFLVYTFNVTGWTEFNLVAFHGRVHDFKSFTTAMMVGRMKLALLAIPFALWTAFGSFLLYDHFFVAEVTAQVAEPEPDAATA